MYLYIYTPPIYGDFGAGLWQWVYTYVSWDRKNDIETSSKPPSHALSFGSGARILRLSSEIAVLL